MKFTRGWIEETVDLRHHDTDTKVRVELLAPLRFSLLIEDMGFWQGEIPKGFISDLGSVPQVFQNIPGFGKLGRMMNPCIVHDALYNGIVAINGHRPTREESDNILCVLGANQGENWLVRNIYWAGVRIGGEKHFEK